MSRIQFTHLHQSRLWELQDMYGRELGTTLFKREYSLDRMPPTIWGAHTDKQVIKRLATLVNIEGKQGEDYLPHLFSIGHELVEVNEGVTYLKNIVKICTNCGAEYSSQYALCDTCLLTNKVHSYGTRVETLLPPEETRNTLFGVELEYEEVFQKDVMETLVGHCLAKSDATITNGVEVVSRPASLWTHKEAFKKFFANVKTKASVNTGMHVHIDKKRLTEIQRGVIIAFMNNKNNLVPLEKIAGRAYSKNRWCSIQNEAKITTGMTFGERNGTTKYVPVNIQKLSTIEIRVFSSPETYEEFAAKLEFVDALSKYSSPYSISVKKLQDKLGWDTFKGYVNQNRKEYPNLVSFYSSLFN